MHWTTTKVLNYIIAIGGIVFGFLHPDKYEAMIIMVGAATGGHAFKNYTQSKSS